MPKKDDADKQAAEARIREEIREHARRTAASFGPPTPEQVAAVAAVFNMDAPPPRPAEDLPKPGDGHLPTGQGGFCDACGAWPHEHAALDPEAALRAAADAIAAVRRELYEDLPD